MITLYSYNISPYAAKVRAILRHKQLAFEERIVHPLRRRGLKRLSGQLLVPVLTDGDQVVADSSHIARFLDERYPAHRVIPEDPALRARALLLEEWADEGLPRIVQPVRWFIPRNAQRTLDLFRSAYPPGRREDVQLALVRRVLVLGMRQRYGNRVTAPSPAQVLNRLAEGLDVLDAALAESGWLCGSEPTVADFAAWGFLHFLEGLDGWETVKMRRRVVRLIKAFAESAPPSARAGASDEAYDAEDAALLDASHHRRANQETAERSRAGRKRLPLA
jgi:glutathione S-transferase